MLKLANDSDPFFVPASGIFSGLTSEECINGVTGAINRGIYIAVPGNVDNPSATIARNNFFPILMVLRLYFGIFPYNTHKHLLLYKYSDLYDYGDTKESPQSYKRKPIIVCGDLNVAAQEIDLKNPKTNRKNAGFTDEERAKFQELLDSGFIDTYRTLHPDKVEYSWWSYRFKAREKNAGWRIDYFLLSDFAKDKLVDAQIKTEVMGSDHCPVLLEVDI